MRSKEEIGGKLKETLIEKSKHSESIVIMLFRLKQSLDKLNKNIESFNKSSKFYSRVIILLIIIIAIVSSIQIIMFF